MGAARRGAHAPGGPGGVAVPGAGGHRAGRGGLAQRPGSDNDIDDATRDVLKAAVDGGAERWTRLGCPYDAALAHVESQDEDGLRSALAEFQRLGARPAAAIVARRLREHGVRGLPRGPRPDTKSHPARLTRREAEVLALVQQGAPNADIAARLYLSEKTVHHHVSAILRKLGVSSRGQAVSEAARLGFTAR